MGPACHNYWAHAVEPKSRDYWACCNHNERLAHRNAEQPLLATTEARAATKTQCNPKRINIYFLNAPVSQQKVSSWETTNVTAKGSKKMFLKMSSTSKGKQLECPVQRPQLAQTVPQKQGQRSLPPPHVQWRCTPALLLQRREKKRNVKSQVVSTAAQIGTSSWQK